MFRTEIIKEPGLRPNQGSGTKSLPENRN